MCLSHITHPSHHTSIPSHIPPHTSLPTHPSHYTSHSHTHPPITHPSHHTSIPSHIPPITHPSHHTSLPSHIPPITHPSHHTSIPSHIPPITHPSHHTSLPSHIPPITHHSHPLHITHPSHHTSLPSHITPTHYTSHSHHTSSSSSAQILMVVQAIERNIFDQRAVEFELWKRSEPDRRSDMACLAPNQRSHTNVVACFKQYCHNCVLFGGCSRPTNCCTLTLDKNTCPLFNLIL